MNGSQVVNNEHLTNSPEGNSEFCFDVSGDEVVENKIHCFPMDQSLSDLLYSFLRHGKKNTV